MKTLITLMILALSVGCTGDDIEETPVETGTIQLTVSYAEAPAEGAIISVAIFECPFTMPPLATPSFAPTSFPATGDLKDVPAGDYCLYAILDNDPEDGPDPKYDLDPINVLPEGASSIPFTLAAGQTLEMAVELHLKGGGGRGREDAGVDQPDAGEVDPEGISVEVTVSCPSCEGAADLFFYGTPGAAIGMPTYYHVFSEPSFPYTATLTASESVVGGVVEWAEGEVTFEAYQDTTPGGMRAEEGEPISAPLTVTLEEGVNVVELTLE